MTERREVSDSEGGLGQAIGVVIAELEDRPQHLLSSTMRRAVAVERYLRAQEAGSPEEGPDLPPAA